MGAEFIGCEDKNGGIFNVPCVRLFKVANNAEESSVAGFKVVWSKGLSDFSRQEKKL